MQTYDLNDTSIERLKLMVYGDGGSGKTSLCASAGLDDRTAPVLHLDALGNPVSIRKFMPKGYRGKVLRLTKLQDLNPIFDWLYKGQPEDHVMVKSAKCEPGYKTLVIDGLTKVQMLAFSLALGRQDTPEAGKLLTSPEIANYKQVLIQMTNDLELFVNLPLHVITTALEDKDKVLTKPGKIMQKGDKMGEEAQEGYYQYGPAIDGKGIRLVKATIQTIIRMVPVALAEPIALAEAKAQCGHNPLWSVSQFLQTKDVYAKDQHGFNLRYAGDLSVTTLLDILGKRG